MKKNKKSPIENYITILKWLSEKHYLTDDWELLLKEFMVDFIKDYYNKPKDLDVHNSKPDINNIY
jgi:hypothetical protein